MKRAFTLFLLFMVILSSTAFAEESGVIVYFDGKLIIIETNSSGYSCGWEYWFPYEPIGQDDREGDDVEGDDIEGALAVCGQQTVFDRNKESYYDIYIDEARLTESEARDWLDDQQR